MFGMLEACPAVPTSGAQMAGAKGGLQVASMLLSFLVSNLSICNHDPLSCQLT